MANAIKFIVSSRVLARLKFDDDLGDLDLELFNEKNEAWEVAISIRASGHIWRGSVFEWTGLPCNENGQIRIEGVKEQ